MHDHTYIYEFSYIQTNYEHIENLRIAILTLIIARYNTSLNQKLFMVCFRARWWQVFSCTDRQARVDVRCLAVSSHVQLFTFNQGCDF